MAVGEPDDEQVDGREPVMSDACELRLGVQVMLHGNVVKR